MIKQLCLLIINTNTHEFRGIKHGGKKSQLRSIVKDQHFRFHIKKIPAKSLFCRACSAKKRRKTNENVCVIPLHEISRWEGWDPINQAKGNAMSVGWGRLVSNPFSRN